MAKVLIESSSISCDHEGTAAVVGSPKLTVGNTGVLLENGTPAWTIAGCTQTDASSGQKPCTKVVSVATGPASKLKVGGVPVLLDTLSAQTEGTPTNGLSGSAGQNKLTAV